MVILAKDIIDNDQVTITAISVEILSENLKSKENHIIILSGQLYIIIDFLLLYLGS